MSNILYYTTSLLKNQNTEKEQRFAYLVENFLIINKVCV